jgi:hypothetical protein
MDENLPPELGSRQGLRHTMRQKITALHVKYGKGKGEISHSYMMGYFIISVIITVFIAFHVLTDDFSWMLQNLNEGSDDFKDAKARDSGFQTSIYLLLYMVLHCMYQWLEIHYIKVENDATKSGDKAILENYDTNHIELRRYAFWVITKGILFPMILLGALCVRGHSYILQNEVDIVYVSLDDSSVKNGDERTGGPFFSGVFRLLQLLTWIGSYGWTPVLGTNTTINPVDTMFLTVFALLHFGAWWLAHYLGQKHPHASADKNNDKKKPTQVQAYFRWAAFMVGFLAIFHFVLFFNDILRACSEANPPPDNKHAIWDPVCVDSYKKLIPDFKDLTGNSNVLVENGTSTGFVYFMFEFFAITWGIYSLTGTIYSRSLRETDTEQFFGSTGGVCTKFVYDRVMGLRDMLNLVFMSDVIIFGIFFPLFITWLGLTTGSNTLSSHSGAMEYHLNNANLPVH